MMMGRFRNPFPQCPILDKFILWAFRKLVRFYDSPIIDPRDIDLFYKEYFYNFLVCLKSEDPTLDMKWSVLFDSQPAFIADAPSAVLLEDWEADRITTLKI